MASPTSSTDLERILFKRDNEIHSLTAQPASLKTGISSVASNQTYFLRQLQHLFAGVAVVSLEGRLVWANASSLARCNRTLAKLVGNSLVELVTDASTRAATADGLQLAQGFQFDFLDPSPEHTGGWLRAKIQPICNPAGAVEKYVGLL